MKKDQTSQLRQLKKRTDALILKSYARLGELLNIITILQFHLEENGDKNDVVKEMEKRIRKMERSPGFAGRHEGMVE
jgi:hypothetical protein